MILTIFSNRYCNTITHFTPLNEKQTQRQLLKKQTPAAHLSIKLGLSTPSAYRAFYAHKQKRGA
ncbi:hypothetical protein HMPREF2955_01855 [Prevotella sp. HMSC073D09]|nr:hypothetical protein HMPREF2955_01855 [Prevotella sp. HMSC073D09]